MSLDSDHLRDTLQRFSQADSINTWWLAYSGGVDSQVLLNLLAPLKINLQAVYVDHGLQAESSQWAKHCEHSCRQLAIPFQSIKVDACAVNGDSPEAAARKARYQALSTFIDHGDCLLTAQHQDDQAETFLLQLFRGAGSAGLSCMPFVNVFSNGWHMRPLLEFTRTDILNYANTHQLTWIEDPSNQSDQYDRNYLRNHILPKLQQRWPSLNKTLSTAAQQQAENETLITQLATIDLSDIQDDEPGLSLEKLKQLDEQRLRNLLRLWIKHQALPIPPRNVMQQIVQQMFSSRDDADPVVKWSHLEMHRYRQRLYLIAMSDHNENDVYHWESGDEFFLTSLGQSLYFKPVSGEGLKQTIHHRKITIKFRQGGETIRLKHREGTHKLKKLFQEAGVPSWMRSRIPLLYSGDELIAVVGYWVAEKYACSDNETGLLPMLKNIEY